MINNDQPDVNKAIIDLKLVLSDKLQCDSLLEKLKKISNEKSEILQSSRALNALNIIYFLYPKAFESFTDFEFSIIRNPIKRIKHLLEVEITDPKSIEDHNLLTDDIHTEEVNMDIFENTNYPFFLDDDLKVLTYLSRSQSNYYLINNEGYDWSLQYNGHGHNRSTEIEQRYLQFASEEINKLKQILETIELE